MARQAINVVPIPAFCPSPAGLGLLNDRLDEAARLSRVNEDFLWSALAELDEQSREADLYRVTLIRLIELTLWLAGGCVDSGELAATGDLMINPKRKLLFIKGRTGPIVLDRHRRLSEQTRPWRPPGQAAIDWLKRETVLHTPQQALIPELLDRLTKELGDDDPYVHSVLERQKKIASAMGHAATIDHPHGRSLEELVRTASREERPVIEQMLCRFDLTEFKRIGRLFWVMIDRLR